MTRFVRTSFGLLGAVLLLLFSGEAQAQQRALGTRAFVPSSQVLGMGGATTAYPTARSAIFYNPAHLTSLRTSRTPVTMIGMGGSISNNFSSQLSFYNERLAPAFSEGLSSLSEEEAAVLFEEIFEMGRAPTVVSSDILLPSFALNRGSYGFGGGFFIHGEAAYNVEDAGAGVPGVDFTAVADFMAVASAATDFSKLGLKSLSAGLTAKYDQRYLTLKNKPLDTFEDDESVYMLGGSNLGIDLGLLYELNIKAIPGQLYLGAVWSDLAIKKFDYKFSAYYIKNEEERNDAAIAAETALAQERYQLGTTFRAGASYVLPSLGGPLGETAVAIDYVRASYALADQPLLGSLSLGFQTKLGRVLSLRTGLNQGYSTVGAGLQLPFVRLDYAYYGSEQGRLPGQSPSWNHRVAISLGSY